MQLQLQNPSRNRIFDKVKDLAVIFVGLNAVFFILLLYYIIMLNSEIGLSINDPRFGDAYSIGCLTCDIDQYILPSRWYQFLIYLIPLFLGYFLSYQLVKWLHTRDKLGNKRISMVLSSKIWLVILVLLPIFLVYFSGTVNFSLIYDRFAGVTTFRIDIFIMILLTLYSFSITNINYFRYHDDPEIGSLSQLVEAAKKSSPGTFVYFFYLAIVTSLPYFPEQYIYRLLNYGFPSLVQFNDLPRVGLWSGLFVISIYLIIPLILLNIFEVYYTPDTATYEVLLRQRKVGQANSYNTPLIILGVALLMFGLYHRAIFNLYNVVSVDGSYRQKLTPFLYNPYFVDVNARNQPPSSTHLFGTDFLGRDIYSIVMFGLGNTILFGIYVVIGRLVFAFGYIKLKDRLSDRVDYIVQTVLTQVPRILIILLMGRTINHFLRLYQFSNQFIFLLGFILTFSVFFWGDLAESIRGSVSLNSGHSKSDWLKIFFKFLSVGLAMVFVEIIFLGFYFLNAVPLLGTDLNNALNNYPTQHTWGWFYPLLVIVLVYVVLSMVGNYLTVDNTRDQEATKEYLYPDQGDDTGSDLKADQETK